MSFQRLFGTVLLGALSFGCVAAPPGDAEEVGQGDQALEYEEEDILIVSTNGLPPGLLMDDDMLTGMAALAMGPLDASTPLADSADGRLLLGYLARCALRANESVTLADSNNVRHSFGGLVGLVPGWSQRALTASDGRWISACLLAHANAYGMNVDIALHGDHATLQDLPPTGFTQQEAGFYGDLFQAATAFACLGSSPSDPEATAQRICGRSEACHFAILGDCEPASMTSVCHGGPRAYNGCKTEDLGVTLDEVITVYARPGTFTLPPSCAHSPLEVGWPLAPGCSPEVSAVCAIDPYCCETAWDDTCVSLASH